MIRVVKTVSEHFSLWTVVHKNIEDAIKNGTDDARRDLCTMKLFVNKAAYRKIQPNAYCI